MRIRLESGPEEAPAWFERAQSLIIANHPSETAAAFAQMQVARDAGYWLAGYATYELGYALEPRLMSLMPPARRLPLLCFGVFDAPTRASPLPKGPGGLHSFAPHWDLARYAEAFARLHDLIGAGDLYQANLTFPLTATVTGDPLGLYAALAARQKVGHGALVLQDGLPDLLSRSPELFFRIARTGQIETRPMKGTLPRGAGAAEDASLRAQLSSDPKTQAENLMIVDLLRNDLSRICQPGSVRVPDLFSVETYATVHQMTSRITGDLIPSLRIADLFHALFPCGSITGAPKLRAMEIIRALESAPRGVYCGSIGWFAPDGRADLNVAIRTLMVQDGRAVLNVGGGVVWDSTAPAEYEEALWKARFATTSHLEPV